MERPSVREKRVKMVYQSGGGLNLALEQKAEKGQERKRVARNGSPRGYWDILGKGRKESQLLRENKCEEFGGRGKLEEFAELV